MTLRTILQDLCGVEHVTSWRQMRVAASDSLVGDGAAAIDAQTAMDAAASELVDDTLVVAPESEEQIREVLRLAAADGLRLLPAGAGEHLHAREVAAADVVLSLRRRAGIVDYESEDLTLVAQSGATLRSVDTMLREQQQCLPIDCARGRAATIGGAVAANRSGLDRLLQGSWKDHVLGARVLHADGTVTQTGSRVVKSVAGYDLAKLYVGSRGSLVVLLDVNLRLLCAPQTDAMVVARLAAADAEVALQELHADHRLQTSAILLTAVASQTRNAGEVQVVVRFAGRPEVVSQQVEACCARLGAQLLAEEEHRQVEQQLRDNMDGTPTHATLRLVTLPVAVVQPAIALTQLLDRDSGFIAQYGVGTMHLVLSRDGFDRMQAYLRRIANDSQPHMLRWGNLPLGWPLPETLASAAPAVVLQQALRKQFDPAGVLNPTTPGLPQRSPRGGGVGAGDSA